MTFSTHHAMPAPTTSLRRTCIILGLALMGASLAPCSRASGETSPIALNERWAERSFAANPPPLSGQRVVVTRNDDPANSPVMLNRSATGKALRLADKTYERGLGLNAHVVMRVTLEKPAKRFLADIGVDRNADGQVASVRFRIVSESKELFVSDVLRPGSRQSIDVPLDGAKSLDLIVDNGGDDRAWDQANWCDPRIELTDGEVVWLDQLAQQGGPLGGVPFSFVYGGKTSSELLPNWKAEEIVEEVDAKTRRRTLTFTDPQTGLEVKAVADVFLDTPGVDWTVYFTNTGTTDTPILEQVRAVDVAISPPMARAEASDGNITGLMSVADRSSSLTTKNNPVLGRLHGTIGCVRFNIEDFMAFDEEVPTGKRIEWGTPSAWSSFQEFPMFTLDWGRAGVVTAIGWTGHWVASVDRSGPQMRLSAGMRNLRTVLRPGESIRSPRILQVYWEGGNRQMGDNLFRRTMLARIVPRDDKGEPVFPPFAYPTSSFYESNQSTEANERSHIDSVAGLGFEYYWLDAWWIKGGHPHGMGHWGFPITRGYDPVRFPNGVKPVRDYARQHGLKFLLWFAPEELFPNTDLAKEHPEWVMKPGPPGPIDLTNPEARDYITRYMNTVIKEWGIDWWRCDGGPSLKHWTDNDTDPNRTGMTEMRYVEGYYAFWDAMRAANPGLLLDNCAGGGTRIDLETSSRSLALWRTDSAVWSVNGHVRGSGSPAKEETAILNQSINHGLNRYVPLSTSGTVGAEPYYLRSAFNGGLTWCEDIRPAGYPRELLKQGIAEGKRLRKYLLGDFYPLTKPTASAEQWCAYQYHLPESDEGVVFVFRRHQAPFYGLQLSLQDIDSDGNYEVTEARTYNPEKPRRVKGAELQRYGALIEDLPGSLLIQYRKIQQGD
jgi:alpha-galactosidase